MKDPSHAGEREPGYSAAQRHRIQNTLGVILIVFLGYLIVPGPIVYLLDRVDDVPYWLAEVLSIFFTPVIWLYQEWPVYESYIDWWDQLP